jgi:hypothetical protein
MKRFVSSAILLFLLLLNTSVASAGDFGWADNLNIMAKADSSGFRAKLVARFRIGDAKIKAVIGDVSKPSDAYMVLRLGEMSHRPIDEVMTEYRANRKKGWGVMAKGLGIKPGSREFHALKRGHDMGNSSGNERGQSSSKGKAKNKGKKKEKGKNKGKGKK